MAKVTIRSIVEGCCSSSTCSFNVGRQCSIMDEKHFMERCTIQAKYMSEGITPDPDEKWECKMYENERSKE